MDPAKKSAAQHRRQITTLKRQVMQLERQVKVLARKALGTLSGSAQDSVGTKVRFVAKGLRSQRTRLDLSAEDFGKLVGVSAQSIYNWESEKARPRAEQIAKLAQLRLIGKREAEARLHDTRKSGKARHGKRASS